MKRRWQKAFLAGLEQTGSVTDAAKAAKIGRSAVYQHRYSDPAFARLWDEAIEKACDLLEDEARRRAFKGSDVLLMFLLKGRRPQIWRESRSTIPPAELNKLIEAELTRIAAQKEAEADQPVM
ncbi:MAG: hypothetical protein ABR607_11055 [Pyrinomonadaceae bacterium]